jgi:heme/copper-type cytochrome/quinol oxidase subunit 4
MRKGKTLWGKLRLLHPKNLAKEVDVYGYHFSWKEHILLVLGSVLGITAVGTLFHLSTVCFIVLLSAGGIALPLLILDMYIRMYEQKRFADVTSYMEQMIYSFQKTGKTASAWKETISLFEDGQMHHVIEEALQHLERGMPESDKGILYEAMERIEQNYSCAKIRMVHELLAGTEEYGGSMEDAVLLVLEDIEDWKKRGYQLHAAKKNSHRENVISIVISILLCALALYVLVDMQRMFSQDGMVPIFDFPIIQISTTVFLIFLLYVFWKSSKALTADWLEDSHAYDSDYIMKSYYKVMEYEKKRSEKKNLWVCFHGIGYRIAKKDVTEELYQVLPQWLMDMTLLLQNNNVQVALLRSAEHAPKVLKPELLALKERMEESPEQLTTYTAFCSNFDLPEITSCMKILHAVSENGNGNVTTQMAHLQGRVHQMQSQADDINSEKTAFYMKIIFSYPVVAATVKLLTDLTVGMFVMLQMLGNIGGA